MEEANVLMLRGQAFTLGDLDAGIVEDEPAAWADFLALTQDMVEAPRPQALIVGKALGALLVIGAAAIRAGSDPTMTRERLRGLLRPADGIRLYMPVSRALGFQAAAADGAVGEAGRPGREAAASPAPPPSSGA